MQSWIAAFIIMPEILSEKAAEMNRIKALRAIFLEKQ